MIGRKLTVTILDIGFGGEGVARVDDFVVFVPFVLTGEEVEIEITEAKKRFGRARLLQILKPSPHRGAPPCPYFGDCGGCQYQHIDYPTQLEVKRKQIVDLFQRIGGFPEAVIEPMIPCPQIYGYRNRIMVRSQWDKFKQGLNIGFLRNDNRLVVDVEECKIAEPGVNDQLREVRAKPPPKGGIKVVLRLLPSDWIVPADSFFQNNFHLLDQLVATAREFLQASGNRRLLDIYCGVGFFSLELADLVDSYLGVELDQRAIRGARENAKQRGRENGEFWHGEAEAMLPELVSRAPPATTTVLLDPPRRGCPAQSLAVLEQFGAKQILYVSCHPATLARDLKLLCEKGTYRLARVRPLDMFPQTQHAECVAELRRIEP